MHHVTLPRPGLARILPLLVTGWLAPGYAGADASAAEAGPPAETRATVVQNYGKVPLSFEENRGQADPSVRFLSHGPGYGLFLTAEETVLTLTASEGKRHGRERGGNLKTRDPAKPPKVRRAGLRMTLAGGRTPSAIVGRDPLPGVVNYLKGKDQAAWRTGVPTYGKVEQTGVYPGIDLVFYGNPQQLEYDFVVQPGADPKAIRLRFEETGTARSKRPRLDAGGDLVVPTALGDVRLKRPEVYQQLDGRKQPVEGRFVLHPKRAGPKARPARGAEVGFQLAAYDTAKPLVIDPVLVYSTYLGGSNHDFGYGIAVDGAGNAYVTGHTSSSDFPTVNARYKEPPGYTDAFVTKFNPSGSQVLYSTFLGGCCGDYAEAIAVDGAGNAYVTGYTNSGDFPIVNARYKELWGGDEAFVTKFNPSGSQVLYSTFLGGRYDDYGYGIAVDGAGNAYVTGETLSVDFPTVNAKYKSLWGYSDAFVTKFNPSGSQVLYSTFLGGGSDEQGKGIAVDAAGNAYVTGNTFSSDFPTVNARYKKPPGYTDAFVTKIADSGGSGTSSELSLDVLDGQEFRDGAGITDSPDILGDLGRNRRMKGAAADGVARLVLRARANHPGTVTFSIPAGDGTLFDYRNQASGGASTVAVPTLPRNGQHMAFAVYQAPEKFYRAPEDHNKASRSLDLTVSAASSDGSASPPPVRPGDVNVSLWRPPILLIHGLGSGPDLWKKFQQRLRSGDDSIDLAGIRTVDYKASNQKSFAVNVPKVLVAAINARNEYRRGGIACAQVDVLGHSMGGILARILAGDGNYKRAANYSEGDFNKLITVDSPHTGSVFATALWAVLSAPDNLSFLDKLDAWMGSLLGHPKSAPRPDFSRTQWGALEDLQTDSDALRAMNQSSDKVTVPSHAIVGNPTFSAEFDLADLPCSALNPVDILSCYWSLLKLLGYDTRFSATFPLGGDVIVGAPSQRGFNPELKLPSPAVPFSTNGHVHWTIPDFLDGAVETDWFAHRARELLDLPSDDASFGHFGNAYAASLLFSRSLARAFATNVGTPQQAGDGIRILSPSAGSVVVPGQTLTVVIGIEDGVTLETLMLGSWGQNQQRSNAPWEFSLTIPGNAVGPFLLAVIGRDSQGKLHGADVTVNVQPLTQVHVLEVDPANLEFTEAASSQSLSVTAIYEDETQRDLSGSSTGTTYQSSTPAVATVDAAGTVRAVGNGTATITVKNGAVTAYVPVTVEAGTDLAITQTDSPDPIGSDRITRYALTVRNLGTARAMNVEVRDTLPAGTSLLDYTGTGWSCVPIEGIVTCYLDNLAGGAPSTVTLRVQAPSVCGVLSNQATVHAVTDDGFVDNNVSFATTSCPIQTKLTLTSSANPVAAGQAVIFTATVGNGQNPTGSVIFKSDGAAITGCASVPLAGTSAKCTTSALALGTRAIAANYTGDSKHLGAGASLSQVISGGGYALTVTKTAGGTVASAAAGINCGSDCGETYPAGTSVTLKATAAAGYQFSGWSGDCAGTAGCTVAMTSTRTVSATFVPAFALGVVRTGSGTVTSDIAGINCGSDCSESYPAGTGLNLTATPSAGYQFSAWSGACTGTGRCTLAMSAARNVTATFAAVPPGSQPLRIVIAGNGKVTSNPAGINCGTDCSENYKAGTAVALSAVADPGYLFAGWSGACTSPGSLCSVAMSTAKTVTAQFVPLRRSVWKRALVR